jgi:hypothetical protein
MGKILRVTAVLGFRVIGLNLASPAPSKSWSKMIQRSTALVGGVLPT